PGGGKPWNEMVHRGQSRMSHRDQSAGFTDDRKDGFRRRAASCHERRPPDPKQAREHIVTVARVPGTDERIGDLRPADTATAFGSQRLDIHDIPKGGKPIAYLPDPLDSLHPLRLQELAQRRALRIDEVRQHVEVAAFLDRGNLDAGDQPEAEPPRGIIRLYQPGTGVVIGDADRPEPAL